MLKTSFFLIALLTYPILMIHALTVEIQPRESHCYIEYVKTKRTAFLRIAVLEEDESADIRLIAYGPFESPPSDAQINQEFFNHLVVTRKDELDKEVHDGFNFDTEHRGGWYKYCLDNTHSTWKSKKVSFTTTHGLTKENELGTEDHEEDKTKKEHAEIMERSLDRMHSLLQLIQTEQEYYATREKRHMKTIESNQSRILWCTVFQFLILAVLYGGQMYFLHQWFSGRGNITRQWA